MRSVFSSIVAVSLLLHAALGCCWHQAHAEAPDNEPAHAAMADSCSHEHDHAPADDPAHEPDRPHCHGVCTYLPAHKTQLDQHDTFTSFELAAVNPAVYVSQVAAHCSAGPTYERDEGPPLRLHLLHQILLI